MNYYPFNIDKYRSATAHLTNEEDICYRRLLDIAYDTEKAIPQNGLARKIRVSEEVLVAVLSEFWILTNEGWINDVVKRELEVVYEKSEKARSSAKSRWSVCDGNANAMRTQCDGNANGMLHKAKAKAKAKEEKIQSVQAPTDADFWSTMAVKFTHINISAEQSKMEAWLSVNRGRKLTRKFAVNWLNRVETPLATTSTGSKYDDAF